MNKPLVSVIMPVFNGEKYLRDAIESILLQTYSKFELVIINDASTDSSLEIMRTYDDPRIRILDNPVNMGLAGVRNRGLKEARGEYVAFLDCDDISMPARLEKQVCHFEANPEVGLCGTWTRTFGDTVAHEWRYPTHPEFLRCRMIFDNPFATSSVMLRREVLFPMQIYFNIHFPPAEDYEFWERLSKHCRVVNLPEVLNLYRIHGSQTSSSKKEEHRGAVWKIQLRQLEELGISPSEEEKELHLKIGVGWIYEASKEAILESRRWLSRLKKANIKHKIYPEPAFSEVIAERWFYICSSATPLGWWIWKNWAQSDFHDKSKNLKMAIKCLLRWDPVINRPLLIFKKLQ